MLYVILAGVVFIGILIYHLCDGWSDVGDSFLLAFLFTLVATLIVAIVVVVASFTLADKIEYGENVETQEILAMKDSSSIEGAFGGSVFMTCGYINESMQYVVLLKEIEGYRMFKVEAENALVIEKDVSPKLEQYNPYIKNKLLRKLLINCKNSRYQIYIPKNSTEFQYKVDLE